MTLTAPTPIETTAKSPLGDAVPITRKPVRTNAKVGPEAAAPPATTGRAEHG